MAEELVNDLWNNLNELSNREKYEYITALAESIKDQGGTTFASNMLDALNDVCSENSICPECGCETNLKKTQFVHSELDDNNIENIYYLYCGNCGWDSRNE
ncbi:hypothetical protein ACFHWD_03005 [Clostridium sp. MT-14]|uniref:hypothetical protein n=1 Tax=Clostridium sp. MT-14 TaxID=3348360 RepID=UPI0035F3E608